MNKINNTGKAVILAAIVVVIVLLAFIYGGSKSQAPQTGSNSTSSGNVAATQNSTNTAGANVSGGTSAPKNTTPPPIVIRFITPVTNDQWKIGSDNPIAWDNSANFTGEIDLLDGKTNAFLGVILSETGTNQTSYSWNTREYALSRYSPLKKEILPGTYKIRLRFDGNNLQPITSPAFTVLN